MLQIVGSGQRRQGEGVEMVGVGVSCVNLSTFAAWFARVLAFCITIALAVPRPLWECRLGHNWFKCLRTCCQRERQKKAEKRRRKQREMETSEKNSRNNMQGTRRCGGNRGTNRGSGSGCRCAVTSERKEKGERGEREKGRLLLLQVAIVAACSLVQGVNNIFPTQLPSSCDVCNVQHRSANLKRQAAAVAAANKLKYWQAALVLKATRSGAGPRGAWLV